MTKNPRTSQPQILSFDAGTFLAKFKDAKGWKTIKSYCTNGLFCLEAIPAACNCCELRQDQDFVCQETNRRAVRNSTSQQSKLSFKVSKLPSGPEVTQKALRDKCDVWKLLPC